MELSVKAMRCSKIGLLTAVAYVIINSFSPIYAGDPLNRMNIEKYRGIEITAPKLVQKSGKFFIEGGKILHEEGRTLEKRSFELGELNYIHNKFKMAKDGHKK